MDTGGSSLAIWSSAVTNQPASLSLEGASQVLGGMIKDLEAEMEEKF